MKKILFIFMVLAFIGCKKNSVQTTPINAALLAAFNYRPGTYWIYRDSISGEIDSFYVTSNIPPSPYNGPGTNVEGVYIGITETSISPVSSETQGWDFTYQADMIEVTFFEYAKSYYEINYIPLVNYPFSYTFSVCSGCFDNTSGFGTVINIYNSYEVNNNIFSDVAEINDTGVMTPATSSSHNDWFYICPSAGIIKMRLDHPQDSLHRVWEIQRWNLVK